MNNIIDNERESHEWLFVFVWLCSILTLRKIKRLERYKHELYGNFKWFL